MLTSLDVSNNVNLKTILIHRNQIKGFAMDALISSLTQNTTTDKHHFCVYDKYNQSDEGNICTKNQVAAVKTKGWTPEYFTYKNVEGFDVVEVNSITLDETSLQLTVGEEEKLTATIKPNDATYKQVEWSSSNTNVASIDENGRITANTVGTARITCKAVDGSGKQATCSVTVEETVVIAEINSTNFPDKNFRNYLLAQSYGQDGKLTDEEIKDVTSMAVDNKSIKSMEGIGFFTALTKLNCSHNNLTALDVSMNTALTSLTCGYNKLATLDVSKNTSLTALWCDHNLLASLNVQGNDNLKKLNCVDNKLTTLDVSQCTALEDLTCAQNSLTALDVSKNTLLTKLSIHRNAIKGEAMDALISGMRSNTSGEVYQFLVYNNTENDEGNECTRTQVATVKAKGWTPQYNDGTTWKEYEGSDNVIPVTSITLPSPMTVAAGQTVTLTPTITPADAVTTLTWSSDDETIATVNSSGVVTGVKKGQTFINVETDNGKTAYCKLTVTAGEPTEIVLPKNVTVTIGKPLTITATVIPEGAETTLTWKSDDETIVRVNGSGALTGLLTGLAEGLAIVTVSTSNGLTSNVCKVKVEPAPSGINDVQMAESNNVPVFTLSGQRLAAPKKGLNIVGGKKMVVK